MRSVIVSVVSGCLLSLCSCSKGQTPASSTPSGSASGAVTAAVPDAPVTATLPASATLLASFDLTKVAQPEVLALFGKKLADLEAKLGLTPGQSGAALVAALGVDPARPLAVAHLDLGSEAKSAIAALKPRIPKTQPVTGPHKPQDPPMPVITADIVKDLAGVPVFASYRVLVPAKDPARLKGSLDKLLTAAGLKSSGDGGGYTGPHGVAAVNVVGDTLVVDLLVGDGGAPAMRALRAALSNSAEAKPPALGDAAFAIHYVPEGEALTGFLSGVQLSAGAVSSGHIDPEQRERIMNQGIWEAAQNFTLATSARGARFEHVDLTARLDSGSPRVTMRAGPGAGYDGPGDDAWAATYALSRTGAVGPAFSASRPFLEGWKSPGDEGLTGLEPKSFYTRMRDAGWSGLLVALPEIAALLPRMIDPERLAPADAVLTRLARFGVVPTSASPDPKATTAKDGGAGTAASTVFVGILPDGTAKAAAECVLEAATPCAHKLSTGVLTKDGDAWVELAQVEGHSVLLRAAKKETLSASLLKSFKGAPAAPVVYEVDLRAVFGADLPAGAARMVGSVRRDGKEIVADLGAPP